MDIGITILTILTTLIIIGFLVFVHELVHFLAARYVGIRVDKFAIGFGPKIFSKKWGQTEYSLRLLFLGGYVQMYGDEDPSSSKQNKSLASHPESYQSKGYFQKVFVMSAGVIMNFITAIIVFMIYLSAVSGVVGVRKFGSYEFFGAEKTPYLVALQEGFTIKSENSGIILKIADEKLTTRERLIDILRANENKEVKLELFGQGNKIETKSLIVNGDGIKSNLDLDILVSSAKDAEGKQRQLTRPMISTFDNEKPLGKAQVKAFPVGVEPKKSYEGKLNDYGIDFLGAYIISLNEIDVRSSADLAKVLKENLGKNIEIKVASADYSDDFVLSTTLPSEVKDGEPILGVNLAYVSLGFNEDAVLYKYQSPIIGGVTHSINSLGYQVYALSYLISDAFKGKPEQLSENVGGVVAIGGQVGGVVDAAAKVDAGAAVELLNLTATISIVLAFMNILPIPVLDGGHILLLTIEKLRGKPLPENVQNWLFTIFIVLLIALSVVITLRDVIRLF